jgi:hypothetical protein
MLLREILEGFAEFGSAPIERKDIPTPSQMAQEKPSYEL